MTSFKQKTTPEVFYTAKIKASVPVRPELLAGPELKPGPETVPDYLFYKGKICPYLTITTPKGILSLSPSDVSLLRSVLQAFDDGTAPYSAPRNFEAVASLKGH